MCHKDLTLQDIQKALDAYGKLKTIRKTLETGRLPPEAKVKSKFNRYITDSAISVIEVSSALMCI